MRVSEAPPQSSTNGESLSREAEELLIERTLQGRNDAFGDLVQPYVTSLNRIVRMKLQSESEAEDVVQQSILRAFSHLRQFRREASFKTWLCAIAMNEVVHLQRGRGARFRPVRDYYFAGLADPSSSPHMQCERRENAEQLRRALIRLPEKYRLMIELRDLRELSVAETASSLSVSVSVVKTRHHRARKLLVRSLMHPPLQAGSSRISRR